MRIRAGIAIAVIVLTACGGRNDPAPGKANPEAATTSSEPDRGASSLRSGLISLPGPFLGYDLEVSAVTFEIQQTSSSSVAADVSATVRNTNLTSTASLSSLSLWCPDDADPWSTLDAPGYFGENSFTEELLPAASRTASAKVAIHVKGLSCNDPEPVIVFDTSDETRDPGPRGVSDGDEFVVRLDAIPELFDLVGDVDAGLLVVDNVCDRLDLERLAELFGSPVAFVKTRDLDCVLYESESADAEQILLRLTVAPGQDDTTADADLLLCESPLQPVEGVADALVCEESTGGTAGHMVRDGSTLIVMYSPVAVEHGATLMREISRIIDDLDT